MKRLPKISALLLLLLLTSSIATVANPAQANSAEEAQRSSIRPASSPALFAIHQEKTGISLLNSLQEANSADSLHHLSFGYLLVESAAQKQAATCFRFYKGTDRSLAVKKLIFPFHSHW